jgi:hypothetical protein
MRRPGPSLAPALAVAAAVFLLHGCSSAPERAPIGEEHFFPAPPDLPRVQYLRSFNGSPDFENRNTFLDYLAGGKPATVYELRKPFSVASWKGRIYVTDSFGLQGVNVFDLENHRFFILGKDAGLGEIKKPIHVFVDSEGFKYISDLFRKQVVVYGPDDRFVRAYGDGRSFLPVACVAHGGEVYVLDVLKDRVRPEAAADEWDEIRRDQILVLDKESGRPLRRLGMHGSPRDGFSFASFLACDRLGNLYVSDFMNYRVVKLDAQGNVLTVFGRQGDRAGDFAQLKGIAVDPDGMIYVVDAAFQAVQVFDNSGRPLFAMGGPKAAQGPMDLPAGIWIDRHNLEYLRDYLHPDFEPEYLILVANQISPEHRVAIYAYGKRRSVSYPAGDSIATLDRPVPGGGEVKPLWTLPVLPGEGSAAAPTPPEDAPQVEGGAPN